jgi:hypothetical protein
MGEYQKGFEVGLAAGKAAATDESGQMERLSIEKLAKHFRVSIEQAKYAQDEIGFMYRQRA